MDRRLRSPQRGASLVEFAFVFPVFVLLVMAIIEGSLAFHARNSVGIGVANASRTGSIERDAPDADQQIIQALRRREDMAVANELVRVVIYRADTAQDEPPIGCQNGVATDGCNVYEQNELAAPAIVCTPAKAGGWCPSERRGDDLIGVWVLSDYVGVTGASLFDGVFTDRAVSRIEPEIIE